MTGLEKNLGILDTETALHQNLHTIGIHRIITRLCDLQASYVAPPLPTWMRDMKVMQEQLSFPSSLWHTTAMDGGSAGIAGANTCPYILPSSHRHPWLFATYRTSCHRRTAIHGSLRHTIHPVHKKTGAKHRLKDESLTHWRLTKHEPYSMLHQSYAFISINY